MMVKIESHNGLKVCKYRLLKIKILAKKNFNTTEVFFIQLNPCKTTLPAYDDESLAMS